MGLPLPGLAIPVVAPSLTVPRDHGVWLHDHQGVAPGAEKSSHENPEDPVAVFKLGALHAALEDHDLLTEGDVLQRESRAVSDECVDEGEEVADPGHWAILTVNQACAKLQVVTPPSCGFEAAYRVFGRHN